MNDYLIGDATSSFSISRLRVGLWPILATIALGFVVILPGGIAAGWVMHRIGVDRSMAMPWLARYVTDVVMLVLATLLIAWLGRGRFAEYGFAWPENKSYVLPAIAWGASFGVVMTLVDYFPQIIAHAAPTDYQPLSASNIAGWLSFEGIFVGFGEEIAFRGLLQTFLMQRTSGRIRFLRYDMHIAGVILAFLFALAHITSFWTQPLPYALGQQVYGFALGILYAYWREKSGSLLAPILGHNFSDGVEYALIFLMMWAWR
jgi:membrane protease YdiL (CAAX protease family)